MADDLSNTASSGVCDGLLSSLKECLLKSDCVVNKGHLPSDCLKNHYDELEDSCKHLRVALFNCKRNKVCSPLRELCYCVCSRFPNSRFAHLSPITCFSSRSWRLLMGPLLDIKLDMRKRFRGNTAAAAPSHSPSPVPVPPTNVPADVDVNVKVVGGRS